MVTSDEATGRLLGLAMDSPHQTEMIEDLLKVGVGVDLVERAVVDSEVGRPSPSGTVAIVRHGRILPSSVIIESGDRLLAIESNGD